MITIRRSTAAVEKIIAGYRLTHHQLEPAIVGRDGDTITINIGHEVFKRRTCANCGGPHRTRRCQIPSNYDGDYRRDSAGSDGCSCA